MKRNFLLLIIILAFGFLIAACSTFQPAPPNTSPIQIPTSQAATTTASPTEIPTSTSRTTFKPGDPTSIPPRSEITDPDFQAGVVAYKKRDFAQVQELMEKVVNRNPQLAPPHWYLGRALYEKGNYEAALQQMNQALAIDANYALAYADRGIINGALGNESQELADLQHALELDPSLAKVHHNLALIYYNKGQMDRSLQEYDLALQIDPTRATAWAARADVLHTLGRLDDCIESATNAIKYDKQNWYGYAIRAACYPDSNSEQALADISVAVKNGGQNARVMGQACAVMTHVKSNDQAIEYCTQSIALDPSYYQSIINRGVAYFNRGDYQQALDDFSKALEFGEIPVAYQNRGNAHLKLSQYQAAVEDYKKSLDLYPNGYVYYSLGFAYIQLQDYENARQAFEQGDVLEPERSSENYRLWGKAQVYDHLNQDDKALELYTQLIDQYQRTEAYYFRGRIYEDKGMKKEAISDYETFLELASKVPDDSYVQMLAYDANQRIAELKK